MYLHWYQIEYIEYIERLNVFALWYQIEYIEYIERLNVFALWYQIEYIEYIERLNVFALWYQIEYIEYIERLNVFALWYQIEYIEYIERLNVFALVSKDCLGDDPSHPLGQRLGVKSLAKPTLTYRRALLPNNNLQLNYSIVTNRFIWKILMFYLHISIILGGGVLKDHIHTTGGDVSVHLEWLHGELTLAARHTIYVSGLKQWIVLCGWKG